MGKLLHYRDIKSENYRIVKSWNNRRGYKMHQVLVSGDVRTWLEEEHPQYGINNPDWWKFDGYINITDKLYTILILRWS